MQTWFHRLGQEINPLLLKNGGAYRDAVENEYGSFGDDKSSLEGVKNTLIENRIGDTCFIRPTLPTIFINGSLPELPTVINFGGGDAQKSFAKLEQHRPEGPRMSGEYWAGWFDHWGNIHHTDRRGQGSR